jgi:Arc/MetJ-type ribon-helix-helix transcriptional regulator
MQRLVVSLDERTLETLKNIRASGGFVSMAEVIRYAVRELQVKYPKQVTEQIDEIPPEDSIF